MTESDETADQSAQRILDIVKLLTLRVYDIQNGIIYEDLDAYLNDNKVDPRRRKELRDIAFQELFLNDKIGSTQNWQDNKPSIVLTEKPTKRESIHASKPKKDQKKPRPWLSVMPAFEAKKLFEEAHPDLANMPEKDRRKNPKDYRTYIDCLDKNFIREMPVFDMANMQRHERLVAFMYARKMTKQQNSNILHKLKETLTEIIRGPERAILKDDKPAIVVNFNERTHAGVQYSFEVVPTYQAQAVFDKRCRP